MEARISVRLTPRASRDQIAGWSDGSLRVRVSAPPADGRANEALLRLLAEALGLPKARLRLVAGSTARDKTIAVDGLDIAEVMRLLDGSV